VHVFFPKYLSVRRTIESAWADTPLTKPKISYEVDEKVSAALNWFRAELNPSLGPTESQIFDTTRRTYQAQQQKWQLKEMDQKLFEEEQNPHVVDWADDMKFGELSFSAQRVALFIRAVIRNPDLVVLDEAFSGMDDAARDKCHLFLSRGQSANFRIRARYKPKSVRVRGPAVQESFHSRLEHVKVHGLQDHQALIVISHKKEEVPGCVRDWICLPEAGQGPPRTGQLLVPLELKTRGWDEIWGTKVRPLRTARTEGLPKRKPRTKYMKRYFDPSRETPENRQRRLARMRDRSGRVRASETPEQREKRLASQTKYRHRKNSQETEEQREERLIRERVYAREKWAKKCTEVKKTLVKRQYEAYKANTPEDKRRERWRKARKDYVKRLDENPSEKEQRLENRRKKYSEAVASLTPLEKLKRTELIKLRARKRRENETPEQREKRLEMARAYAKRKWENEKLLRESKKKAVIETSDIRQEKDAEENVGKGKRKKVENKAGKEEADHIGKS